MCPMLWRQALRFKWHWVPPPTSSQPTHTYTNERAQKAQFSTSKCRLVFVRGIFSALSCSILLLQHKDEIYLHNTAIQQYQSKHRVRQDKQISGSTSPHHVPLTHTPVFTHLLTKPSVLHVNRVCRCAEEVLTSSVLHLDWLLICIKREGEVKESSKDRLKEGEHQRC